MSTLKYFQLYVDDYDMLTGFGLDDKEVGIIIGAVMRYMKTGTDAQVPDNLKWPYYTMKGKVDKSIKKYEHICEVNAANASRGAKSRAKKCKESSSRRQPTQRAPFTKAEFLRIAKDATEEMKLSCNKENLDYLLDRLRDHAWTFGSFAIDTEEHLQEYLAAYYPPEAADYDPTFDFARRQLFNALLEHGAASIEEAADLATNAADSYTLGKGYELSDGQIFNTDAAAEAILTDVTSKSRGNFERRGRIVANRCE